MNDYYKNLPRKYMGAGALFFDEKERILIVKPTYKDSWEIPGGVVEENESPLQCCIREIKEEIGFIEKDFKLLSLDYIHNIDNKGDRIMFIFDGGILSEKEIKNIKLPKEELSEYKFVDIKESVNLLGERLKIRIIPTFEAHKTNKFFYLEEGKIL